MRSPAATTPLSGRLDPRTRIPARSAALQRRMQLALGALRGVTLVWAAVVCAVDTSSGVLDRPTVALSLLLVLVVWSTIWTVGVGNGAQWVAGPIGIGVDLALACATVAADPVVYDGAHPQSFGSAWPLLAVVATGVAAGPTVGLLGGLGVGVAKLAALTVTTGIEGEWLSTLGTIVLLGAAGWVGGWVADRLRTTAQEVADAQARAEVARTLHDGVLKTLAVIQRRSDDDELVALARDQDAELRAFLHRGSDGGSSRSGVGRSAGSSADDASGGTAGDTTRGAVRLDDRLRAELARVGRRHSITAHIVVIEPPSASGDATDAVVGAVTEAVVNAAKHAKVDDVWVSVDRREPSGTMVVVHDEGAGFDPTTTEPGRGITESVHGRLAVVGGGATVVSRPGRGTDVTIWVP